MNQLIDILTEKFPLQPDEKEVRKWLNDEGPFRSKELKPYWVEKTFEESKNWNVMDKFMGFGETPLELKHFTPSIDGVVVKEPERTDRRDWDYQDKMDELEEEYQSLKEQVIYEGMIYDEKRRLISDEFKRNVWVNCSDPGTISSMKGQKINRQWWCEVFK